MSRLLRVALVSIAGLSVLPASAWNDQGHRTIAAIAWQGMTPKAREEARRLLGTMSFQEASVWADLIRRDRSETGPWHYKDIFFRLDGKHPVHKPDAENAVWAIGKFSAILGDKSKSDADRAEALKFVEHFVGDIHQPLHATSFESDKHPDGDRGGNDYKIDSRAEFPEDSRPPNSLHYLWDMGAGLFPSRESVADRDRVATELGAALSAALPRASLRRVDDANPDHWAKESFDAARQVGYQTPEDKPLAPGYATAARETAAKRVAYAGYRLADLLNRLLG